MFFEVMSDEHCNTGVLCTNFLEQDYDFRNEEESDYLLALSLMEGRRMLPCVIHKNYVMNLNKN